MSKAGVTLKQLLDLIGIDSEYERVQIVNSSWDIFDDVSVGSPLLKFLYDSEVRAIEAIEHSVIRVDIDDWPTIIKESETDRICVKAEDIILNHDVSDVYINRMYQTCQVALGEKTEEEVGWV